MCPFLLEISEGNKRVDSQLIDYSCHLNNEKKLADLANPDETQTNFFFHLEDRRKQKPY